VVLKDPMYQKDAEYLRDELMAIKERLQGIVEQKKTLLGAAWGQLCHQANLLLSDEGTVGEPLENRPKEELVKAQNLVSHTGFG